MTTPKALPLNASALLEALGAIGGAVGHLRGDGWTNQMTGIGTSRDKQSWATYTSQAIMSPNELSILYHSDDIAHRIVSTRPEEMLRAGYNVHTDSLELDEGLKQDALRLNIDKVVLDAMIWGSLYGGSGIILDVQDHRPPSKPLNAPAVREVKALKVLDRRYLWPQTFVDADGLLGGGYGEDVETYSVNSPSKGVSAIIHASRVIRFEGASTDAQVRRQLRGWTISALQRPFEVLRLFGMSFASVGHLLQDASQGVIKVKDLLHMIAANRPALIARMELLDTSRSVARAVLLDAENEDFTRVSTSFAGLPELLDRIMQRMSAATRIPVTLLMGRSAAGMNATGDSDFRAFYDSVKSEQRDRLMPVLLQIYRLLAIARGEDPDQVKIEFAPLWEMSEAERALLEKQDAERDVALITSGVLLPEEVALRISRGRRGVADTEIDTAAREKSLDIELKMMKDPTQHVNPDLVPPPDPGAPPDPNAPPEAKPKPVMTKS